MSPGRRGALSVTIIWPGSAGLSSVAVASGQVVMGIIVLFLAVVVPGPGRLGPGRSRATSAGLWSGSTSATAPQGRRPREPRRQRLLLANLLSASMM